MLDKLAETDIQVFTDQADTLPPGKLFGGDFPHEVIDVGRVVVAIEPFVINEGRGLTVEIRQRV